MGSKRSYRAGMEVAYGIRFTRHSVHFIFRESGPERDSVWTSWVTRSRKVTTSPSSTTSIRHVIESRHQENNVRKGHQDRPRFNACGSQSSLWPHPAQTPAHDRLPPARKSHVALKLSAAHTDASLVRRPYITNVTQGTAKVDHALSARQLGPRSESASARLQPTNWFGAQGAPKIVKV